MILKRLNDKIKIYKDKHKKQLLLPNPKSEDPDTLIWDLSDPTQRKKFLSIRDNLWIEGYKVSNNSGDTGLQLTYKPIKPLSGGVLQDIIDTVKMTVVKGDLKIYNGQNAINPVADEKEETVGAFTVANLNDTDGDGVIDNVDNDVTATARGRSEVDLMKIIFNKPEPKDLKGKLRVRIVSGNVKIWEYFFKGKERKGSDLELDIDSIPEAGIEWFVEATNYSQKLRDINLSLEFRGENTSKWIELDKVKATAVWAIKTGFKNKNSDSLWSDAGNPLKDLFYNYYGGKFGKQFENPPVNVQYAMGLEFTVYPSNVGNEALVKFDVTRQVEYHDWWITSGVITSEKMTVFPLDDGANDDTSNNDDDNTPQNDHIYTIDGPGLSIYASDDFYISRNNFYEFVRVTFDGNQPQGNGLIGSRCSDKIKWHAVFDLLRDSNGRWKENPSGLNEVKEGHVIIGGNP